MNTTPRTLAALQGRVLIKNAFMGPQMRGLANSAKQVGKMFTANKGQTNGGSIIAGAGKAPMSMNDIALQKREQEMTRNQGKFEKDQAALAQQQQQFAIQQQHEKNKLEIEKMLASQTPAPNVIAPQPEPSQTMAAFSSGFKRLTKDLQRLATTA